MYKLPAVALPTTLKSVKLPTLVKLEAVTLFAKKLPVNVSALAELAATPVN